MANDYFQFKRFIIRQERCAMKVGTDGTLLGAWAHGGSRVLDIGTGTGLIALMMAQRYADASVVGIDIDPEAVLQAQQNMASSPFATQVTVVQADIALFTDGPFDAIVSNPPYFVNALPSPDGQRTMARHTASLTYRTLMERSWQLLTDGGELSVVIPFDCKALLESEAVLAGFFKTREWAVKTTDRKPPRRYLLAFRKHPASIDQRIVVIGDNEYRSLTKDFYL